MERILSLGKLAYGKKLSFDALKKYNIFFAFIFLGIILGVLFSNLFQGTYYAAWESWHTQFKAGLGTVTINGGELLIYIIIEKCKGYALLWILSMTMVGVPYLYAFCIYKGFTIGFLFCLVMQTYGVRAFLVFGAYYFPQCLLYVPVYLMTLAVCKEMNRQWGRDNASYQGGKAKSIRNYVPILLLLLVLLLLGCLLEAYGNPAILKNIL